LFILFSIIIIALLSFGLVSAQTSDGEGDSLLDWVLNLFSGNSITGAQVVNLPPAITSAILSAPNNATDDDLTLTLTGSDPEGDSFVNITNWLVDSSSITVLNMPFEGGSTSGTPGNDGATTDYSGLGNDGTVVNATFNSSGGLIGGAYEFDEAQDFIRLPDNNPVWLPTQDMTFEAWVKPSQIGVRPVIFYATHRSSGSASLRQGWLFLFLEGQGGPLHAIMNIVNGQQQSLIGVANVSVNTWHHVALVRKGTTLSIYVDGTLDVSMTIPAGAIDYVSGHNERAVAIGDNGQIGFTSSGPTLGFNYDGAIDQVHLHDFALSSEQLQNNYLAGLAGKDIDTIVSSETTVGDVWQACVTPNDGTSDGSEVCSNTLKVTKPIDTGDGSDGPLVVSAQDVVVNSYTFLQSSLSSGATVLSVDDSSAFSAGDEVLVIQMQDGAGGVGGTYEFATISGTGANSITLDSGLANDYVSGTFDQILSAATQIVSVPQYTSLTISGSGSLVAQPWNGFTGGIIAFRANTRLDVVGTINASGQGFRPNPLRAGHNFATGNAFQGESFEGIGVQSRLANEGGGGGGLTASDPVGQGGGGGYGTSGDPGLGVTGGGGFDPSRAGLGGNTYGSADLSLLFLGSAGGNGGYDTEVGNRHGGIGGPGGGIIAIFSQTVIVSGSILSKGQTDDGDTIGGLRGGGGSGGSILIDSLDLSINGKVSARGANSTFTPFFDPSGIGGNGRVSLNPLQCTPAPSGLVSWWDADSVSGTTAFDIQDGNDGTLINGATTAPGKVGTAFSFDGVDDFVSVPDAANLNFGASDSFTVDAWVLHDTLSGFRVIVDKRLDTGLLVGWDLLYFPTTFQRLALVLDDGPDQVTVFANITDGVLHHVAGVVDRSTNTASVYIDGVLEGTEDITAIGSLSNTAAPLGIGARVITTIPLHFKGIIDEVEIFNRALSASEIQDIFNAGSAGKCKVPAVCGDGITGGGEQCDDGALNGDPGFCNATCDGTVSFTVALNNGVTTVATTADFPDGVSGLTPSQGAYSYTVDPDGAGALPVENLMALNMPFDGSSSTQTDFSGEADDGSMVNSPTITFIGCQVATCLSFDGLTNYVNLGTDSAFRQFSAITYAFWTKIPAGGGGWVMGTGVLNGHGFGGVNLDLTDFGFFWTPTLIQGDTAVLASSLGLSADTWYHVTFTIDYVGQTRALYINGTLIPTTLSSIPTNWIPVASYSVGKSDFVGARSINNVNRYFDGLLDEVQIYPRALSAAQVAQLFNDGNAGVGGPTVIKSDETTVGNVFDLSVTALSSTGEIGNSVTSSNTVEVLSVPDTDGVDDDVDAEANGARTACNDLSTVAQAGTAADPLKACVVGLDTNLHFINNITKNNAADLVNVSNGADGSSLDVVVAASASGDAIIQACDETVDILVPPGNETNIACGASVVVTAKTVGVKVIDRRTQTTYNALVANSRLLIATSSTLDGDSLTAEVLANQWQEEERTPEGQLLTRLTLQSGERSVKENYQEISSTEASMTTYEKQIVATKDQTYFGKSGSPAGGDFIMKRSLSAGTYTWNYLYGHDVNGAVRESARYVSGPTYTERMVQLTDLSQEVRVSGMQSGQRWDRKLGHGSGIKLIEYNQIQGEQVLSYEVDCLTSCRTAVRTTMHEGVAARNVLYVKSDPVTSRHAVEAENVGATAMSVELFSEPGGSYRSLANVDANSVRMVSQTSERISVDKVSGAELTGKVTDEVNSLEAVYTLASIATFERLLATSEIEAVRQSGTLKFNGQDVAANLRAGLAPTEVASLVSSSSSTGDTGVATAISVDEVSIDYSLEGSLTTTEAEATSTYVTQGDTSLSIKKETDAVLYETTTDSGAGNPEMAWDTSSGDSSTVTVEKLAADTMVVSAKMETTQKSASSYKLSAQVAEAELSTSTYSKNLKPVLVARASPDRSYYLESVSAESGKSVYRELATRTTKTESELLSLFAVEPDQSEVMFASGGRNYHVGDSSETPSGSTCWFVENDGGSVLAACQSNTQTPGNRAQTQYIRKSTAAWKADFDVGNFRAPSRITMQSSEVTDAGTLMVQAGQTHDNPGSYALMIDSVRAYDYRAHRIVPLHEKYLTPARERKVSQVSATMRSGLLATSSEAFMEATILANTVKAMEGEVAGLRRVYATPRLSDSFASVMRKDLTLESGTKIHTYSLSGQGTMLASAEYVSVEYPERDSGALSGQRIVQYSATTDLRRAQYNLALGETEGVMQWRQPRIQSGALTTIETNYVMETRGNMNIAIARDTDNSAIYTNNGAEYRMIARWHEIPLVSYRIATSDSYDVAVKKDTITSSELVKISGSIRTEYGLPSSRSIDTLTVGQKVHMNALRASTTESVQLAGLETDRYYLGIEAEHGRDANAERIMDRTLLEQHRAVWEVKERTFLNPPTLSLTYKDTSTHLSFESSFASVVSGVTTDDLETLTAYTLTQGQTLQQSAKMLNTVTYASESDLKSEPERVVYARFESGTLREVSVSQDSTALFSELLGPSVAITEYSLENTEVETHYLYDMAGLGDWVMFDFTGLSDPDGDGFTNIEERECGSDPNDGSSVPSDNDTDGICDAIDPDDDNDGFPDIDEISQGSDPFDARSTPEICDGKDNDGDGEIDEGLFCENIVRVETADYKTVVKDGLIGPTKPQAIVGVPVRLFETQCLSAKSGKLSLKACQPTTCFDLLVSRTDLTISEAARLAFIQCEASAACTTKR